ncbi:hypothetical protein GW17_00020140 [Ensete ventricosum]|nr:hypothetical protein GW17_00020140 [Ensete ventricosum]
MGRVTKAMTMAARSITRRETLKTEDQGTVAILRRHGRRSPSPASSTQPLGHEIAGFSKPLSVPLLWLPDSNNTLQALPYVLPFITDTAGGCGSRVRYPAGFTVLSHGVLRFFPVLGSRPICDHVISRQYIETLFYPRRKTPPERVLIGVDARSCSNSPIRGGPPQRACSDWWVYHPSHREWSLISPAMAIQWASLPQPRTGHSIALSQRGRTHQQALSVIGGY